MEINQPGGSGTGGGSISSQEITFVGTVNGSNTVFTVASQPTYVVSDGIWFHAKDKNNTTQWTYSVGTVTLSIPPPNYDIWGF